MQGICTQIQTLTHTYTNSRSLYLMCFHPLSRRLFLLLSLSNEVECVLHALCRVLINAQIVEAVNETTFNQIENLKISLDLPLIKTIANPTLIECLHICYAFI